MWTLCAHNLTGTFVSLCTDTKLSEQGLIGISSAALGISSCFDAPFRLYRRLSLLKPACSFKPLTSLLIIEWCGIERNMVLSGVINGGISISSCGRILSPFLYSLFLWLSLLLYHSSASGNQFFSSNLEHQLFFLPHSATSSSFPPRSSSRPSS